MPSNTNTRRDMQATRTDSFRNDTPATTGIPFWDMMLSFGKASQQAMTTYGAAADQTAQATRTVQASGEKHVASVEVIPLGEETLHVGTRVVAGETTRVRRIVVEVPTEQSVTLREERVIVERRKLTGAPATSAQGILAETTVEMSDSFEVVDAWKSMRVTEEVVLRREVTERTETVRDTVRHDEVVLEQTSRSLPAPHKETAPAAKRDRTAPGVQQISTPTPAQLAADLKKVAERFDNDAVQQEKTIATLHETIQPEPDAVKADTAPKAQTHVEAPKPAAPVMNQADKSAPRKN